MKSLKSLVKLLREAEEPADKEKGEDSVDDQIDAFFSDYESESKNVKKEGKDFRAFVRRFLTEAEEDEKEDKEGEKKEDEPAEEKEPEKLTIDDLDVNAFAESVMRLVDNYDSLLEIRNTILRRAVNFLLKSYEADVADAFKENLSEQHGIDIGKSKAEKDDEDFQPPTADRAGAGLGGA